MENTISDNGISSPKNQTSQNDPSYTPPSHTALPLVIFENGKFLIPEEAKKLLSQKSLKKIGIISLVGKYRTGKSFLLNRVILNRIQNSGFNVGPTFRPCTKGIWIWSDPIIIKNSHCENSFPCFLIDTEGLCAYIEEINHDTKIFLIAVLISSLFIFNSVGAIDENSINSLSLVLNLSETIKIKSIDHQDKAEELAEYFPALLWLLRDFSLKLEDKKGNKITEKQYLENALENINGSSDAIQEKNRVRKLIRTYFPERQCFTMVRPVEKETDLQILQNLPNTELRKEFITQAENFRKTVLDITTPKTFKKKILSGSMLIELMESILESINNGCIPVIENTWNYVVQSECIKNSNELIQKFVNEIKKYRENCKDNDDFCKNVKKFTENLSKKYLQEFEKNNVLDEDNKKVFLDKFKKKIDDEIKIFEKENEGIFEDKFNQDLENLSKKMLDNLNKDNNENNENNEKSNYNNLLQELSLFKEKADQLCPDFPHKNNLIIDKVLIIAKKYLDDSKGKAANGEELSSLKNQNLNNQNKINE